MAKPLSPDQLMEKRTNERIGYRIVFSIIEDIIENTMKNGKAIIDISDITAEMDKRGIHPEVVKEIDWTDILYLYKKVGWKVTIETSIGVKSFTFSRE